MQTPVYLNLWYRIGWWWVEEKGEGDRGRERHRQREGGREGGRQTDRKWRHNQKEKGRRQRQRQRVRDLVFIGFPYVRRSVCNTNSHSRTISISLHPSSASRQCQSGSRPASQALNKSDRPKKGMVNTLRWLYDGFFLFSFFFFFNSSKIFFSSNISWKVNKLIRLQEKENFFLKISSRIMLKKGRKIWHPNKNAWHVD